MKANKIYEIIRLIIKYRLIEINKEKSFNGISPIDIQLKDFLGFPDLRDLIIESFIYELEEHDSENTVIMPIPGGGTPWASIIAHELKFPMAYIRNEEVVDDYKKGFQGRNIFGRDVVIIDDILLKGEKTIANIKKIKAMSPKTLTFYSILAIERKEVLKNFKIIDVEPNSLIKINSKLIKIHANLFKEEDKLKVLLNYLKIIEDDLLKYEKEISLI